MYARSLTALGFGLLALALALGGFGIATRTDDLGRIGILLIGPAAIALCIGALRAHTALNDEQLAQAHTAGYVLALDHVARGLLDQPTAPTGGGHDDRLADVHPLHLSRPDERAAG
ncbi:hypothetical protein AB0O04_37470 [Streptomyces althioticus]|uniref:hypothetical protein n=1 Tax=Streptomyces althioticus TaxID=83380 RepID=UPI0034437FBD